MRSDHLQKAIDTQLQSMTVTHDMRQALHARMEGGAQMKKRYKMPIAAVIAAALVMALSLTAVAAGLGVFGRLGESDSDFMSNLESLSTHVNASVTVMDMTVTVDQAYYNGDMLFASITESGSLTSYDRWQEPWSYDGEMALEPELNHWVYDTPKDGVSLYHNLYDSMLQKGESCIVRYLSWPSQAWANDETINGFILESGKNNGELLSALIFDCMFDAEQLNVVIPIILTTDYVWRDEAGQYWHHRETETLDTLRFTVARDADEQTSKFTCHDAMQGKWRAADADTINVTASLTISPATEFACLCITTKDLPRSWADYLSVKNENAPIPDGFFINWTLLADGEIIQPWGMGGIWREADNTFIYYHFFCAADVPTDAQLTISPEKQDDTSMITWPSLLLTRPQ